MKVLLISSSPRKQRSQTFSLAKEVLRAFKEEGIKTEVIHLVDQRIYFCRHCEECHKKILHCSLKDGLVAILEKMLEADGIILATPNYISQITASMKALFDRSAHFIHCQRLLDKYIAGVVVSGSGEDKEVLDYLKLYAHACGAQYSGGVSSAAHLVKEKKEEAFSLGRKLALDIKEKRVSADQLAIIKGSREHFREVIRLRKNEWQEEYQYWQDKGWL